MNINRHNYENFFLLYVDNELPASERKAVEQFVLENPDLKQELVLLQQSTLDPEKMIFSSKHELMKDYNLSAVQEKLNLYLDDEMPVAEKDGFEDQIAGDADVYREMQILQKTRLDAETLVFTDRRSLYRRESTPVYRMTWFRVAAAAVLVGIGFWTGIAVYKNYYFPAPAESAVAGNKGNKTNNNNESGLQDTGTQSSLQNNDPVASDIATTVQDQQGNTAANNAAPNSNDENNAQATRVIPVNNQPVVKNSPLPRQSTWPQNNKPGVLLVNSQVPAITNKVTNNLPKSYLENNNNSNRNETVAKNVSPANSTNGIVNSGTNNTIVQNNTKGNANNPVVTDINNNPADSRNTAAVATVYKTNASGENNLLDEEDNSKRTKVGGFLRKVKRMLERNANIKTGNEVRVAGFEIAIK